MPERAVLVAVEIKGRSQKSRDTERYGTPDSIEELKSLAQTAGATVEETIQQVRERPNAATMIGSGKLDQLREAVRIHEADLVLFDSELTPTQHRNLERAVDCKLLDRTQLILDIFARRARTREGQLQVELAQLNYLLPRLTGRGGAMSRLGGGIGTRGPGETQLETDRRRINRRIKKLTDDLGHVRAGRGIQRRQRQSVPLATVALVGYTNAGKSTLFNRLTGAGVVADARLFATLDPTVRHLVLPSRRKILMSDTVGFIRNLPTTLVQAFRATLEEVTEAALLLHVVDASSPAASEQTAHVGKVLAEIGAEGTKQIMALNKMDLIDADGGSHPESLIQRVLGEAPANSAVQAIPVSARTGEGVADVLSAIDVALPLDPVSRMKYRIPAGEGSLIHLLHERAAVLASAYRESDWEVEADVPESLQRQLSRYRVE